MGFLLRVDAETGGDYLVKKMHKFKQIFSRFTFVVIIVALGYLGAMQYDHMRDMPVVTQRPISAAPASVVIETTPPPRAPVVIDGMVMLAEVDATILVDLRYATADNFTGKVLYDADACAILRQETAAKLHAAQVDFQKLGYRLKVWDAYRPLPVQREMWKAYPHGGFVASPKNGSIHNRAAAVDVTLVDAKGNELPMPSEFDDFSPRAAIAYTGGSVESRNNRDLLARIMGKNGFKRIRKEWWHFEDSNGKKYPLQKISFREFRVKAAESEN